MNVCDFNFYDLIARNACSYPDKDALVCGERRITFQAYRDLCDRYAAGLIHAGTAIGDRIAVMANNGEDFLILCGAAARIGAVVVPVNWRLSGGELAYLLRDTMPRYLVSGREYREQAQIAAAQIASVEKHYVFQAEEMEAGCIPFKTLGDGNGDNSASAVSGHTPYMIIHTAAVGGKPRGSVLSQANLMAAGSQIAQLLHLGCLDAYVGLLPLFHIGGLVMTMAAMLSGGKNVLVERFDPPAVLRQIEAEKGSFFVTFPPMMAALLDAQKTAPADISSLRIACGVDGPETIERFLRTVPHAAFFSLYGQTEVMPVSGGEYGERPGSIGRPAALTRVALFDDLDKEVPPGTPGEICVRSPAVFQGYWNLEDDSAHSSRNGWHHTGDLGRFDENGFLWYTGRKPEKELIKPGGENVYPAEVEKVILEHGAIAEVSVIGVPDSGWGEAVKAVCVLKEGYTVRADELADFVASKIARYKKPKHVVFVEHLPKTATGVIDRQAVKKAYACG